MKYHLLAGLLSSKVTDKSGATSRVYYDELGNRIKEILPENYNPEADDGPGATYTYDEMGRLVEIKDAQGNLVQKNIYDTNGLLVSTTDGAGYGIEYTYDIGGRIKTITSPESKLNGKESQSYIYDAVGNIISLTDGEGNTTTYQKDMWGKTTKIVDPYGVETHYEYDYAGNLTSTTDGNGNTSLYLYNSLNLLSTLTDPPGQTVTYKYDSEGRLAREIDRNGQTVLYDYNSDNNLTSKSIEGKDEDEKYLYSKDGSLLAAINEACVDEYEYTPDGLIKEKVRNGSSIIDYEYDKNGNIINVTDSSGMSTGYTYDTLGRIGTVLDGSTPLATYSYNPDSTIAAIDYSTGIKVSYGYDKDKNITSLENKNPQGEIIGSFSYTYDNNGNQLTKVENGLTTTYTYDKLNRLLSEGTEIYNYDNAQNRIRKTSGTEITTYSYDELNRLTQSEDNGAATTYAYDSNGNLLKAVEGQKETAYTYDGYNRLEEVTTPDSTWMLNVYDPSGLRMAVVENGSRYDFTFDRGNVIEETAVNGSLIARYIRGIGLIAQKDSDGALSYYLHNAHGDVVSVVDGNGEILNSYAYDAFGNTATYAEKVENRFKYAGEQFDEVTGQYYLRTRYYDPEIGRFTQEDKYRGDSLNLYVYVANNPIRYVDPWGLWGEEVHEDMTEKIAEKIFPENEKNEEYANIIGFGDISVDWNPITSPLNIFDQSRHFDKNPDPIIDSRLVHSEEDYATAVKIWNEPESSPLYSWNKFLFGEEQAKEMARELALVYLGKALHPAQDFYAHGDWDTGIFGVIPHPKYFDWTGYDIGENNKPVGSGEEYSSQRYKDTEEATREILENFVTDTKQSTKK